MAHILGTKKSRAHTHSVGKSPKKTTEPKQFIGISQGELGRRNPFLREKGEVKEWKRDIRSRHL